MKSFFSILLISIGAIQSVHAANLMSTCINAKAQGQEQYSVTLMQTPGSSPNILVARSGQIVFSERVSLMGSEAESYGATGPKSYLRVDYEDDNAGLLKFCEKGKEVEVAFDYKECTDAAPSWLNQAEPELVPTLSCK